MLNDVFHSQLKANREKLGLSQAKMATLLHVNIHSYSDLEAAPSEWRMVLPVYKLKFLISLLDIDITPIVGRSSAQWLEFSDVSTLIKSRRDSLRLSKKTFADRVGFFPVFSEIVEGHPLGLELYPAEVVTLVADVLEMSSQQFLKWLLLL